MLIFIMVKNLRKLDFNFLDVTFSPTFTMFLLGFLTTSKINIILSNDIKSIKKKTFLIHFIIKIVYLTFLKKQNSGQIFLMFYCFAS